MQEACCAHHRRAVSVLAGVVLATALMGCFWTVPTGVVTGTVSFDGQPIAAGRLTVLCEGGGKPVFFADITDGAYRIERAPVGSARVTVQVFAAQPATASVPPPPGSAPALPIPANVPRPGKPLTGFPERYLNPDTSGLTFEITPGPQTHDISLVRAEPLR